MDWLISRLDQLKKSEHCLVVVGFSDCGMNINGFAFIDSSTANGKIFRRQNEVLTNRI